VAAGPGKFLLATVRRPGFDVILVETCRGLAVRDRCGDLVDMFVLLLLPGGRGRVAGDQDKASMELADLVVVKQGRW